MRIWFRFFFGTPVRLIATVLVVAALAAVSKIWPGLIQSGLCNLAKELMPLLQLGLILVIMGIGVGIMLRGFRGRPNSPRERRQ